MSKRGPDPTVLNDQQERFCEEYLKDLHGQNAAIRAGYEEESAKKQASRLLSLEKVQDRVQDLMNKRSLRTAITSDKILQELLWLANSDITRLFNEDGSMKALSQLPKSVRRAIASVEIEELFEGFGKDRVQTGHTKKVKMWDKPKALELLGKHMKLFTEKHEHSATQTLEALLSGSWKKKEG